MLVLDLLDLGGDRVRHLVARQLDRLLPHELGDLLLGREIRPLLRREVLRPFREEPDELVAKLPHPVPGLRADGMERVEVAEPRSRLHLGGDVTRLQAVDLVERDHDRHPEREDPSGDEPVARADSIPCVEHEQYGVDVLEGRVDRTLHVLGQRVARTLEPGEVGQHELVVVAVGDAEDAPPGRLRLVGRDRDLAAGERVHERRLADVRAARDSDEARPHRSSSNVSGRSSVGVARVGSPSAFR